MRTKLAAACLAMIAASAAPSWSQGSASLETASISYADVADSVGNAPIVAVIEIKRARKLRGALASGVAEGTTRFLIQATLIKLIKGHQGLPANIEYLWDTKLLASGPASGKVPKMNRLTMLIAASPVKDRPAMVQLIGKQAQMPWTASLEAKARAMLTEAIGPNAPPRIDGIGAAFHVRGSLPGESETQIFLKASGDRPVSLNILRRPGEDTRWSVALGEIVDDAARPPQPETLLWYRLACFLPPALPEASVAALDEADAAAANADYRFVIEALGPCRRSGEAG